MYASTDVPRAVPDLGSATSTLEVRGGHPITNLRVVGLRGTHAYVHDLEMRLRSPSGTTVSVFDRPCAGDYDDFSLDLADDASTSMPCPPTDAAPHVPSHPLAAFVGEPANGTWSLEVIDHEAQDTGTLEGWGLAI